MGKAEIEKILEGKKVKILKIYGGSINGYIIIDKTKDIEAFTTQKEAIEKYNKIEVIKDDG